MPTPTSVPTSRRSPRLTTPEERAPLYAAYQAARAEVDRIGGNLSDDSIVQAAVKAYEAKLAEQGRLRPVAAHAGRTAAVLDEVAAELRRAEAKFPDQHLPDGGGDPRWAELRDAQRAKTDRKLADGTATWLDVVLEETYEAFAETDPMLLRAELVQVAAMAIRWINDIDQRAFVAATA
jgi:hypothetical protein